MEPKGMLEHFALLIAKIVYAPFDLIGRLRRDTKERDEGRRARIDAETMAMLAKWKNDPLDDVPPTVTGIRLVEPRPLLPRLAKFIDRLRNHRD